MKYTRITPTEAGWYWLREHGRKVSVLQVLMHQGHLVVSWNGEEGRAMIFSPIHATSCREWIGPLAEPEDEK